MNTFSELLTEIIVGNDGFDRYIVNEAIFI